MCGSSTDFPEQLSIIPQAGEQDESDDFAEELLGFLLPNTQSRDKALRYRSTQLVARVMELLPEDAGISDETWEEVSEHMQVSCW